MLFFGFPTLPYNLNFFDGTILIFERIGGGEHDIIFFHGGPCPPTDATGILFLDWPAFPTAIDATLVSYDALTSVGVWQCSDGSIDIPGAIFSLFLPPP